MCIEWCHWLDDDDEGAVTMLFEWGFPEIPKSSTALIIIHKITGLYAAIVVYIGANEQSTIGNLLVMVWGV